MSLKDWALGGAVVIALLALFVGFQKSPTVIERIVGSASSPSVIDGCMDVNGVTKCYFKQAMRVATSTPCAFNIGKFGTSTLLFANADFTTASTSVVVWAKGSAYNATTTILVEKSVTTGTQPYVVTTATSTIGATNFQFASSTKWLTLGVSGVDNVTTNGPTGVCTAEVILNR